MQSACSGGTGTFIEKTARKLQVPGERLDEMPYEVMAFFFNETATTEIYTLSLHDALPICGRWCKSAAPCCWRRMRAKKCSRSEEHTSELQSPDHLVCRLLLEKKKGAPSKSTCSRPAAAAPGRSSRRPRASCRCPASAWTRCPTRSWLFFLMRRRPPRSTLFPYTTLCRSAAGGARAPRRAAGAGCARKNA